jgi:hypothetical protein
MHRIAFFAFALVSCADDSRDLATRVSPVDARTTSLERTSAGFRVASAPHHAKFAGEGTVDALLPLRANDPLRLELRGRPRFFVEIAPREATDVVAEPSAGTLIFRDAAPSLDVLHITDGTSFEELRVLRSSRASAIARYSMRLGPEVARVTVTDGRVELRDADGYVRIASAPMFAIDANGTRRDVTVRLDGDDLVTSLDTNGLAYPIVVDPTWKAAGSLKEARSQHAALKLGDGCVVVIGGTTAGGVPLSTAEIYDPKTDAWSAAGAMKFARAYPAAALLANGKVLVAGGNISAAELYDPTNNTWSSAGAMSTPRLTAFAAPLAGGKILIAGSGSTAELYDPLTNAWSSGGALSTEEKGDGGLLVGEGGKVVLLSGEHVRVYDPASNTWSDGPNTPDRRMDYTPIALPDGRIAAFGGGLSIGGGFRLAADADVYSVLSNKWGTRTTAGVKGRWTPSITLRGSNEVVMIGGSISVGDGITLAELYDIAKDTWSPAGETSVPRTHHTATLLADGNVLVVGGATTNRAEGQRHSTAEILIVEGSAVNACKDATTSVGPDGIAKPCGAYRCGADGNCITSCSATSDCAPGGTCDVTAKTCSIAHASGGGDDGGCAYGAHASSFGALAVAAALIGAARRRR